MINPKDVANGGIREVETSTGTRYRWSIPHDLPYFAGHFPGRPTLPGVAMIDLTLELVRRSAGFERAELFRMKSAKFTAVVLPGSEVEIFLTRGESASTGSEWRAEWRLNGGDGSQVGAASFHFGVRL